MKIQRWQTVGVLAVMMLALFGGVALADEAGADSGVEKETLLDLLFKGGPIMIPLFIGSAVAIALGIERFIALSKSRVLPADFIENLVSAWNADPSGKQAVAHCDETGGAVGHIFKAGIRRATMGHEAVEKAIEDVGSREADKMKRSLRPLAVIATISPLLGLLGTVFGMIEAFQVTSASGGGDPKIAMLATGIYEALVTTATGLTIAIPVLILYQFLLGHVDKLIDNIDEAGTEFIYSYTESHHGASAASAGPGGPTAKQGEPVAATVATAGA